jgi:hypothetical protein
VNGLVSVCL